MKTIYFIVQTFSQNKGSFSGFVEKLAIYANKKGYRIKILCAAKKGQKYDEKLSYAQVHRFSVPKFSVFSYVFRAFILAYKVKKYLKKNPPNKDDYFIANGEAALGILGRKFIHRGGDQPAFTFLKNMEIAKNEVSIFTRAARFMHIVMQYFIEKKIYRHNKALILSSKQAANNFFGYYGGEDKPLFVPHSGVNYTELKNAEPKDIKGTKIMFVAANNEQVRKGTIYLKRALPVLFKKYKDIILVHLGDKYDYDMPEDRIIMPGRIPWKEMKSYYKTADILVCCSLSEAFPIVIFEAMAAGTPVVTSDIDGVNEYIKHMKNGYIYRRGDVNGLAKGIEYMIDNPKKRKEMAKISQERVRFLEHDNYNKNLLKYIDDFYRSNKSIKKNLIADD